MSETWLCGTCGEEHADVPLSFACDFPDLYAGLTFEERDTRAIIGSDQCVVDEKWFFIRGLVELPLRDSGDAFLWGVWVSVTEKNYDEIGDLWTSEGRETLNISFAGRLANALPGYYPSTLNLRVRVHLRPVGQRPVFLIEDDHELRRLQEEGITLHRAADMAHHLMTKQDGMLTSRKQ